MLPSIDQPPPRPLVGLELLDEIIEIAVLVHGGRALGDRLREADRVDDRRMVERVAHDEVAFLDDGCSEPLVRVPRRDETHRRFRADETRQRRLERAVHGERPADEAHTPGARAELLESIDAGLHHTRLVAEAEVVVGREDEDFAAAFHLDAGGLGGVEVVQRFINAVRFELVNCALETGDEVVINGHFEPFTVHR
jgi:hypothetical protein